MKSVNSKSGFGTGLFLVIAGLAMLGERMGWISTEVKWGLPVFLVAAGASALITYFKQ